MSHEITAPLSCPVAEGTRRARGETERPAGSGALWWGPGRRYWGMDFRDILGEELTHEWGRGRSESRLLVLGWVRAAGNTGLGWEPNPRHVLRHWNLETPKWRRQGAFPS